MVGYIACSGLGGPKCIKYMKCPSNMHFVLFVILQVRPGPVTWSHTAPGENMVPKQAYEVEENGKRHCKARQIQEQ